MKKFVCNARLWQKPRVSARGYKGFTLIEMLVSLGLFSVVVTLAVGSFITALNAQRQAAALIAANNNVVLVLEQLAREVRTGRNFCPGGGGCLAGQLRFYNASGELVVYRLDAMSGTMQRIIGAGTPVVERLTGENVVVRYLNFDVFGEVIGDGRATRVTVAIGVSAKGVKGVSEAISRLQTTITSRQQDEP